MMGATVCSGIGAPETAMPHWQWQFCAEIEPFPSAVLAHHYPNVPNRGDMTRFKEWPDAAIDVLVGGTPCQSFSVAGLRKGLDDPRGNLALVFLALADRYRPEWVVFENVPGLLSSVSHDAPDPSPPPPPVDMELDGQELETEDEYSSEELHALNCFLAAISKLGYGWAYRLLDAQWHGLAQRRRRVFVVGHLGDWRRAASVLFEPEGLRGDSAPSREAGEGIAEAVAGCLRSGGDGGVPSSRGEHIVAAQAYRTSGNCGAWETGDKTDALTDLSPTLRAGGHDRSHANAGVMPAVCLQEVGKRTGTSTTDPRAGIGISEPGEPMFTLQAGAQHGVGTSTAVRRLTPRECARLQGFPDDYLDITYRGKSAADGSKYKALGNSMAVPCIGWILRRIELASEVPA